MSQERDWHPDPVQVLLAADDELPPAESARIQRHVAQCDACQRIGRDVESVRARYGDAAASEERAAGAERWRGFESELTREARLAGLRRLRLPQTRWLRWVAVVPIVLLLVVLSNRVSPTVMANELLEQSIARESASPQPPLAAMVRIVSPSNQAVSFTWTGGSDSSTGFAAVSARGTARSAPLEEPGDPTRLFAKAGLDATAPLSVAQFQAWRRRLASKTDHVDKQERLIVIRTRSTHDAISEGTIVLYSENLRPASIQWVLDDATRIDVELLPAPPALAPDAPTLTADTGLTRRPAPAITTSRELDRAEVAVHAILHRLGADLNDEISLTRPGGQGLRVSGIVDSVRTKEVIAREVMRVPHTTVALSSVDELRPSSRPPDNVLLVEQSSARRALLADWFERTFEREADARAFSARALELAAQLRLRALAHERLTTRYPASALNALDSESRDTIEGVLKSHRTRMGETVAHLRTHLDMLLASDLARGHSSPLPEGSPSDVIGMARRVDRHLVELFTDVAGTDTPGGTGETLAQLTYDLVHLGQTLGAEAPPQR